MTEEAPIRVPIEDVLDLHAFGPADVLSVVEEYLLQARGRYSSVRLIHGKGTGYQREQIRELLSRLDFVEGFGNAPEQAGGWGATIVWFTPGSGRVGSA